MATHESVRRNQELARQREIRRREDLKNRLENYLKDNPFSTDPEKQKINYEKLVEEVLSLQIYMEVLLSNSRSSILRF